MVEIVTTRSLLLASIIKKQLMALTGLMMSGFLIIHLAGNLLLFESREAFNQYAFFMLSNPIIKTMEWLLAVLFLGHAVLGFRLIIENRRARSESYFTRTTLRRGSNMSLVSMAWTGPLMFLFLVVHLLHFRFGPEHYIVQGGVEMRDLYRSVVEHYSSLGNVLLYTVAMAVVALHLQHGLWSAFQTFGFNHPKYNQLLEIGSNAFAVLVFCGFGVIPWFFVRW